MKHFIFYITITFVIMNCTGKDSNALTEIIYKDNKQILKGYAAQPSIPNKNKVGILILPAWMGIDEHAKETAVQLSKLGYYVFIADIYGEGNYPKNTNDAGKISTYYKKNTDAYRNRIQLALAQLLINGANAKNIAVIGYCFGGTGALEAARANMPVNGVVSFHGDLARDTTKKIQNILPKILVCHGADEIFVPEEEATAFRDEMRKSKADWQMIYYGNAVHAFTDKNAGNNNATGAAYNKKAANRSWQAMMDFFTAIFSK